MIRRMILRRPEASRRLSAPAIVLKQKPVFSRIAAYEGQQRPVGTAQKSNSRQRSTRRPDWPKTPDLQPFPLVRRSKVSAAQITRTRMFLSIGRKASESLAYSALRRNRFIPHSSPVPREGVDFAGGLWEGSVIDWIPGRKPQ